MATTTDIMPSDIFTLTTPDQDLWADEGGRVVCRDHAGFYLAQEIQQAESLGMGSDGQFWTPLGIQEKQTPEDIARFRYAIRDLPQVWSDYVCEECRGNACKALGINEYGN